MKVNFSPENRVYLLMVAIGPHKAHCFQVALPRIDSMCNFWVPLENFWAFSSRVREHHGRKSSGTIPSSALAPRQLDTWKWVFCKFVNEFEYTSCEKNSRSKIFWSKFAITFHRHFARQCSSRTFYGRRNATPHNCHRFRFSFPQPSVHEDDAKLLDRLRLGPPSFPWQMKPNMSKRERPEVRWVE